MAVNDRGHTNGLCISDHLVGHPVGPYQLSDRLTRLSILKNKTKMLEQIIAEKLRSYIIQNNPDLLLRLQEQFGMTKYIEDKLASISGQLQDWVSEGKPQYIIEELSLEQLTADLRPSRFNYLKSLLEEEFAASFSRFAEMGVLTYELTNLVAHCWSVFEQYNFSESNEENRHLRYAVTAAVDDYLIGA